MSLRPSTILAACVLFACAASGQDRVTTFGIQLKPMVPSKFFGTGPETTTNGELTVDYQPMIGHNMGMVIRQGLTRMWSLETGISFVQRNYRMRYRYPQLPEGKELRYRLIGYEIPLQALVYVRLGDQLWMNASGGLCVDMYPSNVESQDSYRRDTLVIDYYQKTWRNGWIRLAVLANYGFEWRTKESGYFYVGASFHRPFSDIAVTEAWLEENSNPTRLSYSVSGSYLTLDLRYFFHEDPARKKRQMRSGP